MRNKFPTPVEIYGGGAGAISEFYSGCMALGQMKNADKLYCILCI